MASSTPQERAALSPSDRAIWTKRLIVALTILSYIVIGAIVVYGLSLISNALIILLISVLLAYMVYPLTRLLQRYLPRLLAVTIAYVVVVAALGAILYFVVLSIVRQSTSSIQAIQPLFGPQGQQLLKPVQDFLGQIGVSQKQIDSYRDQLFSYVQGFAASIVPFVTGIFSNLITAIIIITLSVYFVLDGPRMARWLEHKTPLDYRDSVAFLIHTLDRSVGGYFRGLLLLSTIGAICTGVFLSLFHVPYAALLGVIFFLLFFIPLIGGYVSGVLCILAAIPEGLGTVVIVIVFTVLLQQIVLGQILAPRIYSHSVGLHPIVALFALLAGGQLFGVLGGFLSVPLGGVFQEIVVSFWRRWEQRQPEQFLTQAPVVQPSDEEKRDAADAPSTASPRT